jgi:ribosomal protein S18 acetylase RimI-like enzyme
MTRDHHQAAQAPPLAEGMAAATPVIRAARPEDRDDLDRLLVTSWLTFWAPHLPARAKESFRARKPVSAFLDASLPHLEVAELDGRIVGAILVADDCLEDLHVAPEAQRRGIGRALLARAVEKGAARLEVRGFNLQAIAFYERQGWVRHRTYGATEMGFPVETHEYRLLEERPCRT